MSFFDFLEGLQDRLNWAVYNTRNKIWNKKISYPLRELTYPALGKRKIIFKSALEWDMLVPKKVSFLDTVLATNSLQFSTKKKKHTGLTHKW